jgi:hypothetical protein
MAKAGVRFQIDVYVNVNKTKTPNKTEQPARPSAIRSNGPRPPPPQFQVS